MPERFRGEFLTMGRYTNLSTFYYVFVQIIGAIPPYRPKAALRLGEKKLQHRHGGTCCFLQGGPKI